MPGRLVSEPLMLVFATPTVAELNAGAACELLPPFCATMPKEPVPELP